jgi:multicomponent K+:H+ antiporter subunit E/multicomponent Na+:H+ antiporter subunit E
MRALRLALALGVIYALTLASADPVDLLMGAAAGGLLAAALGRRLPATFDAPSPPLAGRLLWFPVFAGAVLADIVTGTWDVALRVVGLRHLERPGIVRVPIGERSDRGVAVSALATTLSPGSVLVDVDWKRRDLLVHVINASDPDAVRADLQRFYDRYQRRVYP